MNRIKLLCIGLLLSGSLQAGGVISSEPAPAQAVAQPTQEEQLRLINIRILELELEHGLKGLSATREEVQTFIKKIFHLKLKKLELTLKDEDVTDEKIDLILRNGMGVNYPGIYPITIIASMRQAGKTNKEIYIALCGQLESDRIARRQQTR